MSLQLRPATPLMLACRAALSETAWLSERDVAERTGLPLRQVVRSLNGLHIRPMADYRLSRQYRIGHGVIAR